VNAQTMGGVGYSGPLRVVVTKVGLDGHDRGAKVIAQGLRDAGMEVIYGGLRRTPAEICEMVLHEDADVLGLSILSGAVVPLTRRVHAALVESGLEDTLLVVGGITSPEIVQELADMGINGVFGPGTSIETVASYIRANVDPDRSLIRAAADIDDASSQR
jgi:methylmalonyl-CoA mutase C-terminal domain/subunit